jgi:hypothetical protein
MPYGEPDPADPQVLVGVAMPGNAESLRDMAYVFAEELARLGFDERRLLRLFRTHFYTGLHRAYRALGETAIREIVRECVGVFGTGRATPDATPGKESDP